MWSEGKQLVLAHVLCQRGRRSSFYVFDLEANKVLETPVATVSRRINTGSAIVRLGSLIYVVGGRNYDDDDDDDNNEDGNGDDSQYMHCGGTSFFELPKPHILSLLNQSDTIRPVKCILGPASTATWKVSPADVQLAYPTCASLGGKIYALTCSHYCTVKVFTPQSQDWKFLSPLLDLPPGCLDVSTPVIPDEKNDRLLVHFMGANVLYAYYPANANWECLDPKFWAWSSTTALVDDVLYSHIEAPDFLRAYDVTTKSRLKVVHSPPLPVPYRISHEFLHMIHLGDGMLCLTNYGFLHVHEAGLTTTIVQFIKFRVRRANLEEVHVTHDAFNCFSFENCLSVTDFLVL